MKNFIMLNGAPGVGKTTVGLELRNILPNNAFLDKDWCWLVNPFTIDEEVQGLIFDNVKNILKNFIKCTHISNIIFCMGAARNKQRIEGHLPEMNREEVRVYRFILHCSREERVSRACNDNGMIKRSKEMIEDLKWEDGLNDHEGIRIDTTNLTPKQVAEIILNKINNI